MKRPLTVARCRGRAARRRTMAPTETHRTVIRHAASTTASRFGAKLPSDALDDVVQEVFLRLWKSGAEAKLGCMRYLRHTAASATIDLLRRQSARKRRVCRSLEREAALARSIRTPEEILIAKEEAYGLLAADHVLRGRVEQAMRECRYQERSPCAHAHAL